MAFQLLSKIDARLIGIRPRALFLENLEPDLVSAAPLWTDDYSDLISALKKPYFRKLY